MVRDAIIECFTQTQQEVIESMKVISGLKSEEAKKINVDLLIENVFDEVGGDCYSFHAIKLRGFPLEGKKTPFGVLSLISMRFIPQLKSWGFLAWTG